MRDKELVVNEKTKEAEAESGRVENCDKICNIASGECLCTSED